MALTDKDRKQMQDIAELEVRRYFDYYLQEVFPEQVKGIKHHAHQTVEAHDASDEAHGGAIEDYKKFKWKLIGFASAASLVAGLGGAPLMRALGGLVGLG